MSSKKTDDSFFSKKALGPRTAISLFNRVWPNLYIASHCFSQISQHIIASQPLGTTWFKRIKRWQFPLNSVSSEFLRCWSAFTKGKEMIQKPIMILPSNLPWMIFHCQQPALKWGEREELRWRSCDDLPGLSSLKRHLPCRLWDKITCTIMEKVECGRRTKVWDVATWIRKGGRDWKRNILLAWQCGSWTGVVRHMDRYSDAD